MSLGKNIKKARIAKGYSQKQLGDMVGLSRVAITQFEGETNKIAYDTVINLSEILNIPEQDMFPDFKKQREYITKEEIKNNPDKYAEEIASACISILPNSEQNILKIKKLYDQNYDVMIEMAANDTNASTNNRTFDTTIKVAEPATQAYNKNKKL